MDKILDELKKPFNPALVKWLPGTVKKDQTAALALAYADPRAYMERLDEVCGMEWSVTYTPWGDKIVCHVTINGATRSSSGEPDSQSERSEIGGTSAEAQAFKRACAMFGLGRYLYALPSVWVEFDGGSKQFTPAGKAKLEGIIVQHYRRTMGKPEDTTVLPAIVHRNTVAIAAHEDIDQALEEIDKGIDDEPARNPDAEWNAIPSAMETKQQRVAPTRTKGNTFLWPSSNDGDAMQMATDILHYEVTVVPAAYTLITKFRKLHDDSHSKALSTAQVSFVSNLIDKVTGDGSAHIILCALSGAYPALPGWKCNELITLLKAKDMDTVAGLNGVATAIKEALKETA